MGPDLYPRSSEYKIYYHIFDSNGWTLKFRFTSWLILKFKGGLYLNRLEHHHLFLFPEVSQIKPEIANFDYCC